MPCSLFMTSLEVSLGNLVMVVGLVKILEAYSITLIGAARSCERALEETKIPIKRELQSYQSHLP